MSTATALHAVGAASARHSADAIDALFRAMCARGASDLHLSVGLPPMARKDGRMEPLGADAAALTSDALLALLMPILPEQNAGGRRRSRCCS
jgi:Tfp pilus assembly pilus retraction ATPase PilT